MPSNSFHKLVANLDRTQTSILMQLRMEHVPLNKYLHRINKIDSPNCLTFQQGKESVHHYLFDCMTWKHERWFMGQKLGRAAKSADHMLNTCKGVQELLKFIGHTSRFKKTLGDVLPLN